MICFSGSSMASRSGRGSLASSPPSQGLRRRSRNPSCSRRCPYEFDRPGIASGSRCPHRLCQGGKLSFTRQGTRHNAGGSRASLRACHRRCGYGRTWLQEYNGTPGMRDCRIPRPAGTRNYCADRCSHISHLGGFSYLYRKGILKCPIYLSTSRMVSPT